MSTPACEPDRTRKHNGHCFEPLLEADESPVNEYREASRKLLMTMNRCMDWMRPAAKNRIAWWQVQFALGTVHCEGRTMTSVAAECGVKRATISKGATELCRICGVDPSYYMKREEAQKSYQATRKQQLTYAT